MLNAPTELQLRLVKSYFHRELDLTFVDDLDLGALEPPTLRLLAALLPELQKRHPNSSAFVRLQGKARYDWVIYQLQRRALIQVMNALKEASIPTLVIKGAALCIRYYPAPQMRPMSDMDILVPRRYLAQTEDLLTGLGWTNSMPFHSDLRDIHRASCYSNGAGVNIEPHWCVHQQQLDAGLAETVVDLFSRSIPLTVVEGTEWRTLSAEDHLLLILVNGSAAAGSGPRCRWLLDSLLLLRQERVDWEAVTTRACELGVARHVASTLAVLKEHFEVAVPLECQLRLQQHPFRLVDFLEYRAVNVAPTQRNFLERLFLVWLDYKRLRSHVPMGLLNFLAKRWDCEHRSNIFSAMWNRLRVRQV